MSGTDLEEYLCQLGQEFNLNYSFKHVQKQCLELLCFQKAHVFAMLPSGYGKSDIYAWCPVIRSKMEGSPYFCLVISPLISLIREQVKKWTSIGLGCVGLYQGEDCDTIIKGMKENRYSLIFCSPEALIQPQVMAALESLKDRVAALAFDEAHCINTWGRTFHSKYIKARRIRAVLGKVPVMMLTAAATETIKEDIKYTLGLCDVTDVITVPDRPNVHLSIKAESCSTASDLQWYITQLMKQADKAPKTLIFCRSIDSVTSLYGDIVEQLEYQGVEDSTVEMFHSHVDPESLEDVPAEFAKTNSHIRCLISTVVYGMAMQVKDLEYVIHWGPPSSILDYWQEVGSCTRGDKQVLAFLYTPSYSDDLEPVDAVDTEVLDLIQSSKQACIRETVLSSFSLKALTSADIKECCGHEKCCSFCDKKKTESDAS